jgi:hypothetical protein
MWTLKKQSAVSASQQIGAAKKQPVRTKLVPVVDQLTGNKIYDDTKERLAVDQYNRHRQSMRARNNTSTMLQKDYSLLSLYSKHKHITLKETELTKKYQLGLLMASPQFLVIGKEVYRKDTQCTVTMRCDEQTCKTVPKSLWDCVAKGIELKLRENEQHNRVMVYPFNLMIVGSRASKGVAKHQVV